MPKARHSRFGPGVAATHLVRPLSAAAAWPRTTPDCAGVSAEHLSFVAWRMGSDAREPTNASWEPRVRDGAGDGVPGPTIRVPLPIPYALPPPAYAPDDAPWAVDVEWEGRDRHGNTLTQAAGFFYGWREGDDWLARTAALRQELQRRGGL